MHKILLLIGVMFGIPLTGWAETPSLSYHPTLQNVEILRSSNIAPVNVGTFALDPALSSSSRDELIIARTATILSPDNNSYAALLKDAITKELRAAGKYDEKSPIVINGLLTKNSLDAQIGAGKGVLAAKFSLIRDGNSIYQKELEETSMWESSRLDVIANTKARKEKATR